MVAVKVNPAKTTHIAVAPSSASGNSQLAITVPAGAVPAGSTVVVAQLPTGLPPLYRVHGQLEVLSAAEAGRLNAHTSGASHPLPVHFLDIDSIYFGIYVNSQEVLHFNSPIAITITNPAIGTSNLVYVSSANTWVRDTSAHIVPGSATLQLKTDAAIEVINLLGSDVTVHYADNGGTGRFEAVREAKGVDIALPSGLGLHKFGQQFIGWSVSGRAPILASPYLVSKAVTLKAVWEPARLNTITYISNGGFGHEPSRRVFGNGVITLPRGSHLARNGYILVGWSLNGHLPALASPYFVTTSANLRAIWLPAKPVYLHYSLNGGRGRVTTVMVHGAGLVQLNRGAVLHRAGYHFAGWSLNGHLPAVHSPFDLTATTTLRAIWVRSAIVIHYSANGGRGMVPPVQSDGGSVLLSTGHGLSRPGYRFAGWSRNGKLPSLHSPLRLGASTVLKAIWIKSSHSTL